jgi:hypothetical protein
VPKTPEVKVNDERNEVSELFGHLRMVDGFDILLVEDYFWSVLCQFF